MHICAESVHFAVEYVHIHVENVHTRVESVHMELYLWGRHILVGDLTHVDARDVHMVQTFTLILFLNTAKIRGFVQVTCNNNVQRHLFSIYQHQLLVAERVVFY